MPAKAKKTVRRVVSVEFWRDDKVLDNFSPEDKLFMLYLLTNPQSTQVGVYNINKKTMAYELGYSIETISVLLDRFETVYDMIRYSPDTHEIAIKNYLRHSILAGGKPVEDLLRKEIAAVKNRSLLDYVFQNVLHDDDLNESVRNVIVGYYESCDESSDESLANRAANGTPSIINNHISTITIDSTPIRDSSNIVVVNTRARARGETKNDNDDPDIAFDDGIGMAGVDELAVYASNNIVNMNGRNMELLLGYRDMLPDAVIKYAIDLANKYCTRGVPSYGYVEKILMGYVQQKVRTVQQAENLEKAHNAAKTAGVTQRKRSAKEESDAAWEKVKFY